MKQDEPLPSVDEVNVTAYALGELRGAERNRVEGELGRSPELQASVTEIRALAEQLRNDFGRSNEMELLLCREGLFAHVTSAQNVVSFPRRRVLALAAIAAAFAATLAWHGWSGRKEIGDKSRLAASSSRESALYVIESQYYRANDLPASYADAGLRRPPSTPFETPRLAYDHLAFGANRLSDDPFLNFSIRYQREF